MIESMACGTPVIATNRGASGDVVEHAAGIIVEDYRIMGSRSRRQTGSTVREPSPLRRGALLADADVRDYVKASSSSSSER